MTRLGAKGAGESGCIGTPRRGLNAVADALRPTDRDVLQLPLTPERVWRGPRRRPARGRPVKPPVFDYVAPTSVREAVDALGDPARDAAVLAGGQSLLLEMHLARRGPGLVVDINRVAGLDGPAADGGSLRVGALVRHAAFEAPQAVPGPLGTLFGQAVGEHRAPTDPYQQAPWSAASPGRTRRRSGARSPWPWTPTSPCRTATAGGRSRPVTTSWGRTRPSAGPAELITSVRFPLLGDDTGSASSSTGARISASRRWPFPRH